MLDWWMLGLMLVGAYFVGLFCGYLTGKSRKDKSEEDE